MEDLIFEAGVYYRFPSSYKPDEPCPADLREFRYERFKDNVSYGVGRVFVMGRTPENFFCLLNSWNRKGAGNGYFYTPKT